MKTVSPPKERKDEKEYRATCHNCSAVMAEKASALKWEMDLRNEGSAREKCPHCGHDIFFYR